MYNKLIIFIKILYKLFLLLFLVVEHMRLHGIPFFRMPDLKLEKNRSVSVYSHTGECQFSRILEYGRIINKERI